MGFRTRPRVAWLLVAAVSPRLSFRRTMWVLDELGASAGRRSLFDRWIDRRLRRQVEKTITAGAGFFPLQHLIGKSVVLPHGFNGIHVSERAELGQRCTILQNVTIGTNYTGDRAAPTVGDDVFIGAGAVLIGRCTIGNGARIGAGVVLTNASIPAGAVIVNRAAYNATAGAYVYPQQTGTGTEGAAGTTSPEAGAARLGHDTSSKEGDGRAVAP